MNVNEYANRGNLKLLLLLLLLLLLSSITIRKEVIKMKANDLTGMKFGDLEVLYFDKERHNEDKKLKRLGKLTRVRRHWICHCNICGENKSIRGENLLSGNTKGCGCNVKDKIAKRHYKINKVRVNRELKCLEVECSNTDNTFLIDIELYDLIKDYCWLEKNDGYIYTKLHKSNKKVLLHRMLKLGLDRLSDKVLIDHINRNRKDNRLNNLRICNFNQNAINVSLGNDNTSGVIGVSYCNTNKKWRAFVSIDKKFISLGYYNDKTEAIIARLKGEKQYYKEFAPQQHLFKKYQIN